MGAGGRRPPQLGTALAAAGRAQRGNSVSGTAPNGGGDRAAMGGGRRGGRRAGRRRAASGSAARRFRHPRDCNGSVHDPWRNHTHSALRARGALDRDGAGVARGDFGATSGAGDRADQFAPAAARRGSHRQRRASSGGGRGHGGHGPGGRGLSLAINLAGAGANDPDCANRQPLARGLGLRHRAHVARLLRWRAGEPARRCGIRAPAAVRPAPGRNAGGGKRASGGGARSHAGVRRRSGGNPCRRPLACIHAHGALSQHRRRQPYHHAARRGHVEDGVDRRRAPAACPARRRVGIAPSPGRAHGACGVGRTDAGRIAGANAPGRARCAGRQPRRQTGTARQPLVAVRRRAASGPGHSLLGGTHRPHRRGAGAPPLGHRAAAHPPLAAAGRRLQHLLLAGVRRGGALAARPRGAAQVGRAAFAPALQHHAGGFRPAHLGRLRGDPHRHTARPAGRAGHECARLRIRRPRAHVVRGPHR